MSLIIILLLVLPLSLEAAWPEVPVTINGSPGIVDVHYNSGNRRIVRIGSTVIALCPESSSYDHTYRSTSNGDSGTWTEIDTDGSYSGCLITGKNNYVYHFYNSGTTIHMIKFLYNGTPAAPIELQSVEVGEADARYRSVSASVDSTGKLYVVYHGGSPDTLYITTSSDEGVTWAGPYTVAAPPASKPLNYPRLDVTQGGDIVLVYKEHSASAFSDDTFFTKSTDGGVTWSSPYTLSTTGKINPDILPVGTQTLYVFAQSYTSPYGCSFRKSTDGGTTWSDWTLIEGTIAATGYADPSSALGSDGTIYVSYRNDSRTSSGAWREHIARSTDGGATWEVVYDYDEATNRTGTRSHLRYQTWFNYGGRLECIWLQYNTEGTSYPILYASDSTINIYEQQSTLPTIRSGGVRSGGIR